MSDQEKKVAFIPFHALNEFMRTDYRREVVRSTMLSLPQLPRDVRATIDRQTRRNVKIPGFRNSVKAPASVKVGPMIEAFEKKPEIVAAMLAGWTASRPELRDRVYDLLVQRDWKILPADADRTKLPGFLTKWPPGEDFETLNQAFAETFPEADEKEDDVSLMVVWISGRLPIDVDEEALPEQSAEQN